MIGTGKDELVCDLAETYKIYEMENFDPEYIAILASGLREDSRIKMKLQNAKTDLKTMLLARIADNTTLNLYAKTKDAQKGRNRPKLILENLVEKEEKTECLEFSSGEEFMKEWRKKCQN